MGVGLSFKNFMCQRVKIHSWFPRRDNRSVTYFAVEGTRLLILFQYDFADSESERRSALRTVCSKSRGSLLRNRDPELERTFVISPMTLQKGKAEHRNRSTFSRQKIRSVAQPELEYAFDVFLLPVMLYHTAPLYTFVLQ